MRLTFLVALILTCFSVFADVPNPDFGFVFNNLQGVPAAKKWRLGTKMREMHTTAICVYDQPTQGGAISTTVKLLSSDLVLPCLLPGRAVVRNGYVDVTTSPVGSGATIAISTGQTAADLQAATAITSFTVGQYALIPQHASVGTYIKLGQANTIVNGVNTNYYQPTIAIASHALTAGHFRVFIDYDISE